MQIQKIGNYNQFSTNKTQKYQSKISVSFGMECKPIDHVSKRAISLISGQRAGEIYDLIDELTTPEKLKELFSAELKKLQNIETSNPAEKVIDYDKSQFDLQLEKKGNDLHITVNDPFMSGSSNVFGKCTASTDKCKELIKKVLNDYVGARALDTEEFIKNFKPGSHKELFL